MKRALITIRFILPFCLLIALPITPAASNDASSDLEPRTISKEELASRIASQKAPLILDVRSEKEYSAGHIAGAKNIPYDELQGRLDELDVEKSDEIVVYCRSGGRAGKAEQVLIGAGYSNVRDLDGHMQGWSKGEYAVEQPQ